MARPRIWESRELACIQYRLNHREKGTALIDNYLSTHPCIKCGNTDIRVLTFHHRDKSQKRYNVSCMKYLSEKRILSEIEKCDILCANCHMIETYG